MKSIRNILLLMGFLALPFIAFAQQYPQFSQYMFNSISFNPAYAGSREILVINVLNRNQWIGVDGAPVTQTFSAHSSIPFSKFGVGVSFINDKLGYEKNMNAFADVSYRLDLDSYDEYKLTFGLKVGFRKYSLDDDLLNDPGSGTDPFLNMIDYKWRPNFGLGFYFRGESFYLGLSSPKLLNYNNNSEFASLDRVSYFFNGGYLLDVNPSLKFKPAFLVKYTEGAPVSFDISALFFINEKIWLGASYRISDAIGGMVNFQITKGLSVGYSYEYITSALGNYTTGSHEIMLNYEFEFPKPRCTCKHLYN
jgi:type IX secretion system PorP/SprF family membrane protein